MNNRIDIAKQIPIKHNVSLRVIDRFTGQVVSSHTGHNAATNSLVLGMAHYLTGDGVLNQGYHMLSAYVPKYISLGTMGLINQDEDSNGLPLGIGSVSYLGMTYNQLSEDRLQRIDHDRSPDLISEEDDILLRYSDYIIQTPGYGADGYDENQNNFRPYLGLGPTFDNRPDPEHTIDCELISLSHPRVLISFRDIVPESEAELPQTIDVVYSAMISTAALAKFREPGKDYIFVTEAGLWSDKDWKTGGENGMLAGYRIVPPNTENWGFIPVVNPEHPDPDDPEHWTCSPEQAEANREILQKNILRVGVNQVVQVIWKIQIGAMDQLGGLISLYPHYNTTMKWFIWE